MDREKLLYYCIRILTYPCQFLSYRQIHRLGRWLGSLGFYLMREYRKRALSNLALATDLKLSRKQIIRYAKKSFQNLAINCLEFPKFAAERDFSKVIRCENPEAANAIYQKGKGIVFFCGHQSNWEALFLDGTTRMEGVAVGKSIKNPRLYQWILSIREKNGGKIVLPRNAVKEGLKALKRGAFLGIVGDQGMPDSGYSFPFFGRRAWTSPAPALLAYKTNCPMIFAETRRVHGAYRIHYHPPIWPDQSQPQNSEVQRMMDEVMHLLQESIQRSPGDWLWQHNRWKQQNTHRLYKRFRQDCICIILPEKGTEKLQPHLPTLKEIYSLAFLTLMVPKKLRGMSLIEVDEIYYYEKIEETMRNDLRFKLVFNFTENTAIHAHYERLSAFETINLPKIMELASEHAKPHHDFSDLLKRALCKPGTIWKREENAS